MDERFYMKRALTLARRGAGRTSPNPLVGAVLVKDGKVVAEDYHKKAGEPHAEALALSRAGEKAKHGTLYVTLEPCCHTDKRTPPCTKAIISSGVRRVVCAMADPNPKVSGRGFDELRNAGIEVSSGILEAEARTLNEPYIKYIAARSPFVLLKCAMTLDGKIATPKGESKWITGEKARRLVHKWRGTYDAVMTAVGTVKADDPSLTCRIRGGRNPKRIIIDPELESPSESKVFNSEAETIIVTRKKGRKLDALVVRGVKAISYEGKLDLAWLMKELPKHGVYSVMIEGGSSLASHALEDGIVDKVAFFIAPKIIGGAESFPVVGGKSFRTLENAYMIKNMTARKVGEDLLVEGEVKSEP